MPNTENCQDLPITMQTATTILGPDEPSPVRITGVDGRSPLLILSDHNGRLVPALLGDLGVSPADMERHIAWDIGIDGVSTRLSEALDAVMIAQRYSRLVIDCNRAPGHPTSIPPVSDSTSVPANQGLTEADCAARVAGIFQPYHAAITAEIDRRIAAGAPCAVIAMHSFTPVYGGVSRPWQAGILHDREPEFGLLVGDLLREAGYLVGDNEPYTLSDESDYTVPVHAEHRGLPYLELEIRQDLIAGEAGQREWASVLARALPEAWRRFTGA